MNAWSLSEPVPLDSAASANGGIAIRLALWFPHVSTMCPVDSTVDFARL